MPMISSTMRALGALFITISFELHSAETCPPVIDNKKLISKVRATVNSGHAIILIRHTEKGDKVKRKSCIDTESGLTKHGKDQAEMIRDGFIALGAGKPHVIVSPYCRTRQTAEIVFSDTVMETNDDLGLKTCNIKKVINGLGRINKNAQNVALVTHSSCIEEEFKIEARGIRNFGIVAFLPSRDKLSLIGCVWPSDWNGFSTTK